MKSRKAKALLAYLAQSPGRPRSREEIVALLWSDRGAAQARASLRQTLSTLRKELGEHGAAILRIDADSVALEAARVAVDPNGGEDFLAGLHVNDPAFDDWVRDMRLAPHDGTAQTPASGSGLDHDRPYVAVLPFANLSGDPDQQYFADGITEDIIAELSRFQSLWVIGRSSSFDFSKLDSAERDAGRSLGVSYIVEGSVRKAGDQVRVAAQLMDASDGLRIWADRYDRKLEDIFVVQDEVVAAVVAKLGLSLDGRETTLARRRPPNKLSGYDLLLRARSAWWHGDDRAAYDLARRSVEADPGSAAAHAYFSLQHAYQFFTGSVGLSLDEIAENCRVHAEAALALDDTDPIVHAYASMAFGFSPLAAKERGLKHIEIASTLNPHDCEIMLFHAWQLAFAGEPQEALILLAKASKLNPLGGFMISGCYADTLYINRDYDGALESYKGLADPPPGVVAVFVASLAQLGRIDEAKALLSKLESVAAGGFKADQYARAQFVSCLRKEDKDNWRRGFALAGVTF
ncbi:winged helix-turn-helix domain-containing protein [Defluviimonas sp. WL0002]|uniref:Winged helix-turn-helix domain-containing protein n=1 Tax=Albidovulum marisflavi TaxID=2984159 RepID=A0ABT2Z8M2_9RHOB|nr:winged helix-turn-helix domain-containing protein [Defluviimonas sp. WL0002]MCV2867480.1 winged helix-turn-helix domain-containing protein [Defluviimonas sp. WL0002]